MNIAVILAGGTGTRLGGDIPKQYMEVGGKPVIGYCLDTFFRHPSVDAVQIVAEECWREYILKYIESIACVSKRNSDETIAENTSRSTSKNADSKTDEHTDHKENRHANYTGNRYTDHKENIDIKWKGFSAPGSNRQLSIYHALEDCMAYASPDDHVMIHDAARPLVSDACIAASFEAVRRHDGVLPALPMKDTVYLSADGKRISSLLDRKQVFAGQAPETFHLGRYYEANRALLPERIKEINGSTEPAILAGLDVAVVEGDEGNFKITTVQDLERFRQKVAADAMHKTMYKG